MFGYFSYWLLNLVHQFNGQDRITWTPEADQAWAALMYLVQNAPILYSPTPDGQFAVKSDASLYAYGGVLFQNQRNEHGQYIWRIIDMWSQIMPNNLRNAHCKLHEAYGTTGCTRS